VRKVMDTLPSPVRRHIERWTDEFHRLDLLERASAWRAENAPQMRLIAEDIRLNVPVYTFAVLTHSGHALTLSLFLPDCDPQRVRADFRIPESHIVSWRRRANSMTVGIRVIYTNGATRVEHLV
jgi:hypothetical protein